MCVAIRLHLPHKSQQTASKFPLQLARRMLGHLLGHRQGALNTRTSKQAHGRGERPFYLFVMWVSPPSSASLAYDRWAPAMYEK